MSSHTAVNFSCLDHVAYVELDRPEASNSLNTESLHLLKTILKENVQGVETGVSAWAKPQPVQIMAQKAHASTKPVMQ